MLQWDVEEGPVHLGSCQIAHEFYVIGITGPRTQAQQGTHPSHCEDRQVCYLRFVGGECELES